MVRARNKENKGLPARWRHYHGALYYQVPPGQEAFWDGKKQFRLGKTYSEAYMEWARRIPKQGDVRNINQLLDRWLHEIAPTVSWRSQRNFPYLLPPLRAVFGDMPPMSLKPQHVYRYIDNRGKKLMAVKEIKLLSGIFMHAIRWGYVDAHPFAGQVVYPRGNARKRYVEDWELDECLNYKPTRWFPTVPMLQSYILLKLQLALRQSDLLELKWSQFTDEGIEVTPSKTRHVDGKTYVFCWTPELRTTIELVKQHLRLSISALTAFRAISRIPRGSF